jgi:hypothetical protein
VKLPLKTLVANFKLATTEVFAPFTIITGQQ